jgi:hypothetical protein
MAFFLASAVEAADIRRVAPLPRHGDEVLLPDCEAKPRYRDRIEFAMLCDDPIRRGSVDGAQWPHRGACFNMRGQLMMPGSDDFVSGSWQAGIE